jgi:hypothetical protein
VIGFTDAVQIRDAMLGWGGGVKIPLTGRSMWAIFRGDNTVICLCNSRDEAEKLLCIADEGDSRAYVGYLPIVTFKIPDDAHRGSIEQDGDA